jgi:hypothetical protein
MGKEINEQLGYLTMLLQLKWLNAIKLDFKNMMNITNIFKWTIDNQAV